MNPIEQLQAKLEQRFPEVQATLMAPATKTGSWWLDLTIEGQSVTVEWRHKDGFGVSSPPFEGYGEGPDECFPTIDAAFERIETILLSKQGTKDKELTLGEIRTALNRSQADIGKVLGTAQNAVSKMERRGDVRVSSLASFLSALGGRLQLRAIFPGWTVNIRLGDDTPPVPSEVQPPPTTTSRTASTGRTARAPSSHSLASLTQNRAWET